MYLFYKIEHDLISIKLSQSDTEIKAILDTAKKDLDKLYRQVETEKFTVFLTTILIEIIKPKELEFSKINENSRSKRKLKPQFKAKLLNIFLVNSVNKYSSFLQSTNLFDNELNHYLRVNLIFNTLIEKIEFLNLTYSENQINESITKFKKDIKEIAYKDDDHLTKFTIKFYSILIKEIDKNTKNSKTTNKLIEIANKELGTLNTDSDDYKQIYESLIDLEFEIINLNNQLKLLKKISRIIKTVNPYIVAQYNNRYLTNIINEELKKSFENLIDITHSVTLTAFHKSEKDYRINTHQNKVLIEIEDKLYSKGYIERFENKILWIKHKSDLNRFCDYLIKNNKNFTNEEYRKIVRTLYKRYNIEDKLNRNDTRQEKYNSNQYSDDFKKALN